MTLGEQLRYWGIGAVCFALILYLLSGALLPFLVGGAIAYLADPIADRLERLGLSRLAATVAITFAAALVFVLAMVILVPLLIDQVRDLIQNGPRYIEAGRVLMQSLLPDAGASSDLVTQAIASLKANAQSWSAELLNRVVSGGAAVLSFLTVLVFAPVVAFYLLYDWDRLVAVIDDLTPLEHRPVIRRLGAELDDVLAGFIRGQLTVCLIQGCFYALALTIIGLDFGVLIGLFAGLISFIPFVGSILGGVLSIGIAVLQFWNEPGQIVAVAVVFFIGQAVEGNYLTPKLVGDHVKLHPVWLMFALSAFGSLFGFAGLMVAVPAAAGIGVLSRFLIEHYREGRLYMGTKTWEERRRAARAAAGVMDGAPHGPGRGAGAVIAGSVGDGVGTVPGSEPG